MKVIIFGASGMVGRGVLNECLQANDVANVTIIVRQSLNIKNAKLTEIITADLANGINDLTAFDACFYCLGISATGLSEEQYKAINYDLTIDIAQKLQRQTPNMTFVYISGSGTDSTEQGKIMWARVKGKTENKLQHIGFKAVYLFRPGIIQPLDGIESKTKSYRIIYKIFGPIIPLIKKIAPNMVLTTRSIGQAMLNSVRVGYVKSILEVKDIIVLSETKS